MVTNGSAPEDRQLLELLFARSLDGCFFMMLDAPLGWHAGVDKPAAIDYAFGHQRMTKLNDTVATQFGTTHDGMLGRTPADLFGHDLAAGKDIWTRLFNAGRLHTEADERRFDGTTMRIEGDYTCIYDGEGRITGIFGVQRDVTEQHQARETMRRSRTELRNLTARLQVIREEERRRIAREIHDELGQALTGLKLDLSWLGGQLPKTGPDLGGEVKSILGRIDATIDSVRRIATELRPSVLDQLGLPAAMEWQVEEFERRTGIRALLDLKAEGVTIPDHIASNVFRILQEALTNVTRHAAATQVAVKVTERFGVLTMEVADDGKGIPAAALESSLSVGLIGLRERAFVCGGKIDISSTPGSGTRLVLRVPLQGGSIA